MLYHKINNEMKDYVLSCFPHEACGIVISRDGVDFDFLPCENVAQDPRKDFEIKNSDIIEFVKKGQLKAVIHSHIISDCHKPSSPSKQDMIGQVSTGVTWGVIDTDGINVRDPYYWGDMLFQQAMIGKEFHSGVNDCYSLIRKFYKQRKNINLPEFPRDESWWIKGENLYIEGFRKAGFYRITREELQDGDVILGKVRSDVINHGGVILNNDTDGYGLILHHLPNRLSRREPAMAWVNRAELFLRHKDVA